MTPLAGRLRQVLVELTWHRRLLAAGLAAAAVATGLGAVRPAPAPTTTVLVSARDLPGGAPLTAEDLRRAELPVAVVPQGALRPGEEPVGRLLTGPVRRGEPLTDVRVLGPGLLAALARTDGEPVVAATVRLDDDGAAALLRPGDRVDVLAASTAATDPTAPDGSVPGARVLARDVQVLVVPAGTGAAGSVVVVATDPGTAAALAAAAVTDRLSTVVRRGQQ